MSITPEVESMLKVLRPDLELCPRCRCCELVSDPCDECDGVGVFVDDEDGFEADELCVCCDGKGFFVFCLGKCDKDGHHLAATSTASPSTPAVTKPEGCT